MSEPDAVAHCPHCIGPHAPSAHFCAHCGMPLTFYATTAPLESVWALGWLVNRLLEQRPRLSVVLGTWAFALPMVLLLLAGGTSAFPGDLSGLVGAIPGACYLLLAVRVTVRFYREGSPGLVAAR